MDELNFYKYINEQSILVITKEGEIKRLYCPFSAINKDDRMIVQVEGIATGHDWMIFYRVYNMYIQFNCFEIMST
jgi:hypothetical protein